MRKQMLILKKAFLTKDRGSRKADINSFTQNGSNSEPLATTISTQVYSLRLEMNHGSAQHSQTTP